MAETGGGGASVVNTSEGRFDYKADIHVDTSQKRGRDVWVPVVGGNQDRRQGPYQFEIPVTSNNEYIDLNRAHLELWCRVVKADGSDLHPVEDIVAPVNLLAAVMWKEVEATVNNSSMPSAATLHAGLKQYGSTILTYDNDARNTHLMTQLFHMDTPGQYSNCQISRQQLRENFASALARDKVPWPNFALDELPSGVTAQAGVDRDEAWGVLDSKILTQQQLESMPSRDFVENEAVKAQVRKKKLQLYFEQTFATQLLTMKDRDPRHINLGFERRAAFCRGSDVMNLCAPLPADFFQMDNMLAPGNAVTIRLWRYPDPYLLMSWNQEAGYRLVIDDMRLHYRLVTRDGPVPSIETYQFSQTELGTKTVEAQSNVADFRMKYNGTLPKTVVIGMVDADAFDGVYKKNPFEFDHNNLRKATLNINGRLIPEIHGLELNLSRGFRNQHFARAYHWLFDNTGALEADRGNLISWDSFANGSFLLAYDLTPDRCGGLHNHIEEQGYMNIRLDFDHPLSRPIVVWFKLIYPKRLTNNRGADRALVTDITEK